MSATPTLLRPLTELTHPDDFREAALLQSRRLRAAVADAAMFLARGDLGMVELILASASSIGVD